MNKFLFECYQGAPCKCPISYGHFGTARLILALGEFCAHCHTILALLAQGTVEHDKMRVGMICHLHVKPSMSHYCKGVKVAQADAEITPSTCAPQRQQVKAAVASPASNQNIAGLKYGSVALFNVVHALEVCQKLYARLCTYGLIARLTLVSPLNAQCSAGSLSEPHWMECQPHCLSLQQHMHGTWLCIMMASLMSR